jgi:hypothetical protein
MAAPAVLATPVNRPPADRSSAGTTASVPPKVFRCRGVCIAGGNFRRKTIGAAVGRLIRISRSFHGVFASRCCILPFMRSRLSQIAAALALLICLVCPVLEMFDHWDQTVQTGNDTEYALVVLALCVGAAYSFARFIFRISVLKLLAIDVFASLVQELFHSAPRSFMQLSFSAISPPPLALRI